MRHLKMTLWGLLALGTMACTKDDGGKEDPPTDYVPIAGCLWATRNVGESGEFVATPEDYGGLFTFEEAKTACPAGWRTPTRLELATLAGITSRWTTQDGVAGRRFSAGSSTLFLPAAGFLNQDKTPSGAGTDGVYWSSSKTEDETQGRSMHFNGSEVNPANPMDFRFGFSVRCVKPA